MVSLSLFSDRFLAFLLNKILLLCGDWLLVAQCRFLAVWMLRSFGCKGRVSHERGAAVTESIEMIVEREKNWAVHKFALM